MIDALLPLCCGAFIARTDGLRFNDALQFVVTRDGTHTTVAVSNTYRGPAEDFALLVPVPAVLHEGDVKTLDKGVFAAFEGATAPKLTELTERDPCEPEDLDGAGGAPGGSNGVRIESQFAVGEYDVAVLSSSDSASLVDWLKSNKYVLPPELTTQLKPYIASGSKFFVAKVAKDRVKQPEPGGPGIELSPLRFEYDEPELTLPLRLSAASSPGIQDVIVYALAKGKKLEAANRPNVDIPTTLELNAEGAAHFAEFYATLFASVMAKTPDAAVTEFAGSAWPIQAKALEAMNATGNAGDWTVTRLHLQVNKAGKLDDLVLRQAELKGLGVTADYPHKVEWTGKIACDAPRRGRYRLAGDFSYAQRSAKPDAKAGVDKYLAAQAPAQPPPTKDSPKPKPGPAPAKQNPDGPDVRPSTKKTSGGCCDTGGAPPAAPLAVVIAGLAIAAGRRKARR